MRIWAALLKIWVLVVLVVPAAILPAGLADPAVILPVVLGGLVVILPVEQVE